MSAKATSDYRRRRKLNLIKVLGGKCQICGFDAFPDALEFHHEDPNKKDYGIATKGTCRKLETDLEEVKKCFLLCSNCHKGVHCGYYENPKEHIFNELFAQELIEQRNELSVRHDNYCINCGEKIDRGAVRCVECARKERRIVKNRPTREELKQLIRTLPFTKIGEKYGVNGNSIRGWCIAEHLPKTKKEIKSYSDEEWEKI